MSSLDKTEKEKETQSYSSKHDMFCLRVYACHLSHIHSRQVHFKVCQSSWSSRSITISAEIFHCAYCILTSICYRDGLNKYNVQMNLVRMVEFEKFLIWSWGSSLSKRLLLQSLYYIHITTSFWECRHFTFASSYISSANSCSDLVVLSQIWSLKSC